MNQKELMKKDKMVGRITGLAEEFFKKVYHIGDRSTLNAAFENLKQQMSAVIFFDDAEEEE